MTLVRSAADAVPGDAQYPVRRGRPAGWHSRRGVPSVPVIRMIRVQRDRKWLAAYAASRRSGMSRYGDHPAEAATSNWSVRSSSRRSRLWAVTAAHAP